MYKKYENIVTAIVLTISSLLVTMLVLIMTEDIYKNLILCMFTIGIAVVWLLINTIIKCLKQLIKKEK